MLYFKGMPNSTDFYKRILLHVIPACVIVSWSHRSGDIMFFIPHVT